MTTTSYVISLALPYAIIADFIGMNVDHLASETNEEPFILSNQVCACYSTVNNLPAVARRIFDTWADGMTAPLFHIYGQFAHDYDPARFTRIQSTPEICQETRWRALTNP